MYIEKFLQTNYSDEKLAAALAHCEDGKFSFHSCCCFIGIATADHALQGKLISGNFSWNNVPHYRDAQRLLYGPEAELEALGLGVNDKERADRLIPIYKAEMDRRAAFRESKQEPVLDYAEISA